MDSRIFDECKDNLAYRASKFRKHLRREMSNTSLDGFKHEETLGQEINKYVNFITC